MKSRKDKEKEIRRDKRNRFLLWTLRTGWFVTINVITTTYWRHFGWWFLIVSLTVLILGFIPIEKRLNPLEEKRRARKIQKKFPFVRGLEGGQSITIEMKNGEILERVTLISRFDTDLLIITKSQHDKDFNDKDIRTVKLKRVKTIKPECKAGERPF